MKNVIRVVAVMLLACTTGCLADVKAAVEAAREIVGPILEDVKEIREAGDLLIAEIKKAKEEAELMKATLKEMDKLMKDDLPTKEEDGELPVAPITATGIALLGLAELRRRGVL